jgi:hypothetical protein
MGGEGLQPMSLFSHEKGVGTDLRRHDERAARRIGTNGCWHYMNSADRYPVQDF